MKYNIFLACDQTYYNDWCANCIVSIQKNIPWLSIHVLIVNPTTVSEIPGVTYHYEQVDFPNDTCKIAYYQAVRFLRVADYFSPDEYVMTIDCDTLCVKSFTKHEFETITKDIHVQRHQKANRWMAGLVTYGINNNFRNELKEKLSSIPLEKWSYGWDQTVLNQLAIEFDYKKLEVGNWMSFGKGKGKFLTLKGGQKNSEKYLSTYNKIKGQINGTT